MIKKKMEPIYGYVPAFYIYTILRHHNYPEALSAKLAKCHPTLGKDEQEIIIYLPPRLRRKVKGAEWEQTLRSHLKIDATLRLKHRNLRQNLTSWVRFHLAK